MPAAAGEGRTQVGAKFGSGAAPPPPPLLLHSLPSVLRRHALKSNSRPSLHLLAPSALCFLLFFFSFSKSYNPFRVGVEGFSSLVWGSDSLGREGARSASAHARGVRKKETHGLVRDVSCRECTSSKFIHQLPAVLHLVRTNHTRTCPKTFRRSG